MQQHKISTPEERRTIHWLKRFLRNCAGIAAVEFALIFPVMIAFYFGSIETSNMLTANRRVTSVAYTAADITAQAASIGNSELADIFAASSAIMAPFSTAPLKVRITSVVANSSNIAKVAWSDGLNISPRSVGSTVSLPSGLTTAGSSVIIAEVTYSYTSPVSAMITETITFTDTAYLKPRRAISVARTN